MDANGTRFHLLLGEPDWLRRTDVPAAIDSTTDGGGVAWIRERSEVTLRPIPFVFPAAPRDRAPSLDDRRGAARDRFGNWYWIAPSPTDIFARSAGSGTTDRFWTTGEGASCGVERRDEAFVPIPPTDAPSPPLGLAGLAVTDDHYLVVGVTSPKGILVFDLHAGGPPRQSCWPDAVAFAPFDIAPRANGGVWMLDRDHNRVWAMSRAFDVVRREPATASAPSGGFHAVDGSGRERPPDPATAVRFEDAWEIPAGAVAIESLPGDALLILARQPGDAFSELHYYTRIDDAPATLTLKPWGLVGHDIAFAPPDAAAPAAQLGRVYVVDANGNQSFAFALTRVGAGVAIDRIAEYFPMRLFEGKGLVAAGGRPYYDFDATWVPLVDQRRPRHVNAGTIHVAALDGRDPDCVWHRLFIDGCIPPETSVTVSSRAANTAAELATADWREEPRPYLRRHGSELPLAPTVNRDDADDAGTWELLFQHAVGRYLELQLVLGGNGRSTPRLRALRAYYPRFSYLQRYLPGVYREEPTSASFLDRFLANVEGELTPIEDRIAAAEVLFDVRSAPAETLDWLASWLGLVLDPLWSETTRRALIANAMTFYQYRGTIRGLQIALALSLFDCAPSELFTDPDSPRSPARGIRLVEKFRTRETPAVVFGDPTEVSGPRLADRRTLWSPKQGRSVLHERYRAFLAANDESVSAGEEWPLTAPPDPARGDVWREFSRGALGFTPAIASVDPGAWQSFLARRYHGVAAFNDAYRLSGQARVQSFAAIVRPIAVPPDGAPLIDWYDFETLVVPMTAAAHRFTVLLPMSAAARADSAEHQRQLDLASRVVALEKPAHTTFDVRFYWSFFRVGEVRLGYDTAVDLGGRNPDLLTPMVLDRGHLAESYLAPGHPQNVADRDVVGRDRVGGRPC